MIRYINIFTRKYRQHIADFIRWCSYMTLEDAQKGAIIECPRNQNFKKTITIDFVDYDDDDEFDDDFFEAYFPNTKHFYDGDVSYDV